MRKVPLTKGALIRKCFFIFVVSLFLIVGIREIILKKYRFEVRDIIRHFPFSRENSLKEWEEKTLKGKVVYSIEKGDDLSYVRAKSRNTASALYHKIKLDINKRPIIHWKWRVDEFPKRSLPEEIESIKEEDFAARVYVIFPAAFFTKSKVIEYIWSETIPKGTSGVSGYSKNIKILVLEKGRARDWRFEKRDIYEDYMKLFGEKPRLNVGAIAFMTDADSTRTNADAVYDEIEIGYK
jgi:hypothetical protein